MQMTTFIPSSSASIALSQISYSFSLKFFLLSEPPKITQSISISFNYVDVTSPVKGKFVYLETF